MDVYEEFNSVVEAMPVGILRKVLWIQMDAYRELANAIVITADRNAGKGVKDSYGRV